MKKKRNLSTPQHVFVLQAKTPLRSIQNALTFKVKRTCVPSKTYLRLKANALAFFSEYMVVYFTLFIIFIFRL